MVASLNVEKTKNIHYTRPSLSDHHPPNTQSSQSLPNNFFYQKIIRGAVTHKSHRNSGKESRHITKYRNQKTVHRNRVELRLLNASKKESGSVLKTNM